MRNRILLLILGALFSVNFSYVQECGTYEGSFEEELRRYPDFYQSLESKNLDLELRHEKALSKMTSVKDENGVKIIPVVVHVIHNGGGENLSIAQIQNGLNHLNDNINGQAYNFLSVTPDVFAAVRGDLNVEFRLAKIDPYGEPTSGIVRVQSELTVATVTETLSRNRVKALSYWNSYQYFNIWVVQSMPAGPDPQVDPALNGYAQFPWSGSMSTDGVMIRAGVFANGETITHEVGHWLGLCHTWDCGGATCGTDNIADTPEDKEGTFDVSSIGDFPFHVGNIGINAGCLPDSLNPAGEMFMNYMDYQSDHLQSMFTKGQNVVMNETLEGVYDNETNETGIGYREYMCSPENIAATGVADGYVSAPCLVKADFVNNINYPTTFCEGEDIWLTANSKLFDNIDYVSWDMGDGTISPGISHPSLGNYITHTYNDVNSYNVTLTIAYDETTESRAENLSDLDISTAISFDSISETLIVQGTQTELNDLGANNISLHIDEEGYSLGSYWKKNQFTVDSLVGAFNIDTFHVHHFEDTLVIYISDNLPAPDSVLSEINNGDSIYVYIDSTYLSSADLVLLQTPENNAADSSAVFTSSFYVDYLDSIVDYNFYYDTTILHILTYIDSTYLSFADSSLLNSADSTWSEDGLLNSSDSIKVYFAQFNMDTIITLSINTDTAALSVSDSLMFNDADSTWNVDAFVGWVDTVRTFYGTHYYTKYNGYYADTLFYRGEIEKVTYVAEYNNTCTTSVTKEGFVNVSPSIATSNSSSYSYSFENELDLNADWVVNNSTNVESQWSFNAGNNTTWEWANGVASDGSSSIKIDGDEMVVGISTEIVSKAFDLDVLSNPAIKFSWSGAAINTFPVNELDVTYSDDCGESWKALGTVGAIEAANAGLYSNSFKPNSSEWDEIVMTKTQLKNPNIRFKFEYLVNGGSNNFYLDNIRIGEESALMISENTTNFKLSIFPNLIDPDSPITTIVLENLEDLNIEISLINILGSKVRKLYSGEIVSRYQEITIDDDLYNLESGVYFVKVVNNSDVILTDKLIIK